MSRPAVPVLPTEAVKASPRGLRPQTPGPRALALLLAAVAAVLSLAACSSGLVQQGPSDTLRSYAQALEQGRVDEAYHLLSDEAKRSLSLESFRRAVKENPADVAEIAQALSRPASDPVVTATVTVPSGDELTLVYEGGRWRIDGSAVDLYGQATPRQAIVGFLRAFERKRYDVILRYVPDAEREGLTGNGTGAGAGEEAAPRLAPRADQNADGGAGSDGGAADGGAAEAPAPASVAMGALGAETELTAEKLRTAWEGPYKDQINRIVQAIKAALPTAQIEETGDSAAMSYPSGGTVAFVREHGLWKIRDF
jgi:hypothetical protein